MKGERTPPNPKHAEYPVRIGYEAETYTAEFRFRTQADADAWTAAVIAAGGLPRPVR